MARVETRTVPRERLLNRELSWLEFNSRVLDLVADPDVPLLERVKFCSIFSSNLDEFFMVRAAGLTRQSASGLATRSPDGRTPKEALAAIRARVLELTARQSRLWEDELKPALAASGILMGTVEAATGEELAELAELFDREIYPVLTPLAVGPGQPFPYISGLSLSIALFVRDPETGEERLARVKVPEGLPRFVTVGGRGLYVPLESLIEHFLPWLFPGMEVVECALFRVTRDADFEVSDEADDLLEAVELEVRRRRFGDVIRLEVSQRMSAAMLDRLVQGLDVTSDQVYPILGKLDMADLLQIASLELPELRDQPWAPTTPARLATAASPTDFFAEIRRGDILVHLPYNSFRTTVEAFVRGGVQDPDVIAMRSTVYRTSEDSPVVPALIEAAEAGKQSVCLVELKARFDERRNIEWSRALEQAGVHVVYGFHNLKIHAKTTLLVRREGDGLRRYVHIGTGNYHARTARLYEDFGLFTADEEISADVADLFNYLTGFGRPQRFRKLLVAPFNLRARLIDEIRGVAAAAAAGKPARIVLKTNSLTDEAIIEELYAASQAGAGVDVIARGICSLRPGVHGMSETVRVRSVLGRFLEHSRVFAFEAGRRTSLYMGSADLMPRNLDHRIEVVVPVESPKVQHELNAALETLLADNTQAWVLDAGGRWVRLRPGKGEKPRGTHAVLMKRARQRARRLDAVRRPK
ncbi:MAG: polyphosphate kinase 1 [Thermoleophilia bacterium]|nr:polyphosphate kinase 1 [Thermoleophilia bacterium]